MWACVCAQNDTEREGGAFGYVCGRVCAQNDTEREGGAFGYVCGRVCAQNDREREREGGGGGGHLDMCVGLSIFRSGFLG